MPDYLIKLIDIFFPPTKDEILIRHCTQQQFSTYFRPTVTAGVCTALPFSQNEVKAAIHLCKFHNHKYSTKLLATTLTTYLQERSEYDFIIPIPLSRQRLQKRGYNQVEEILKQAKVQMPQLKIKNRYLYRNKNTTPQTNLSRQDRLKNLEGCFSVRNPQKITGKRILLLDDVLTTGATLATAKKALQKHGPKSVTCIALAH